MSDAEKLAPAGARRLANFKGQPHADAVQSHPRPFILTASMKPAALVAALTIACMSAARADAQESPTLRKIKETGIITIGFSEGTIPFSYIDRKPQPIGYSIDICSRIVDAVKARLDLPYLQVKYTPVTSANRLSVIANDIVDLACGTSTNNAERQKKVAFTVTTFVASASVVVKRRNELRDVSGLAGKTVVTTAGSTSLASLVALNRTRGLNLSIVAARDHVASFAMLEADRAAAFVMDDVLLHGFVANAEAPSDYRIHHLGLSVEPYGIILRKKDPEFKKLADDAIVKMFRSGEMTQLYHKWFQSPIPPNNVNLGFPMSAAFKKLIAEPTDSPDPGDYR